MSAADFALARDENRAAQPRGIATRDRLLAAAMELFARKGFEGTSIGDVAGQAGVGVGTVYHHFTDKRTILLELLERYEGLSPKEESGGPWARALAGDDAHQGILAEVRRIYTRRVEHPSVYMITLDLARRDEQVAARCRRIEKAHRRQIVRDLELSRALGKVRSDLDLSATAAVLHLLVQTIVSRLVEEDVSDPEPLICELGEMIHARLVL